MTVVTTTRDNRQVCIDATLEYGDATSEYCAFFRFDPEIKITVELPGEGHTELFNVTLKPDDIPAGTYGVSVIGSGATGLSALIVPLSGAKPSLNLNELKAPSTGLRGYSQQASVVALQQLGGVQAGAIQTPEAATVPIRVVHGCADAPAVNVLVDGAKVATLKYLQYTPYVPVGVGKHTVQLTLESGAVALERPLYIAPPATRGAPESFRTVVAVGSAFFGTLDLA